MALRYYDESRNRPAPTLAPAQRLGYVKIVSPTFAQPVIGTWLSAGPVRCLTHYNGRRELACTIHLGRCFMCEACLGSRVCWWVAASVGAYHATRAVKLTPASVENVQPWQPLTKGWSLRGRPFSLTRMGPSPQAALELTLGDTRDDVAELPPGPDMVAWCERFYAVTLSPPNANGDAQRAAAP
jgi:hypothetical protein